MTATREDVSKANALFLEEASVASCSFLRSVGKDAILTELKTSAMVQHFMSTDGAVAMSSSFFALYEYKDGGVFKAGVTESVGHLPPQTTSCVAFTRILPEHPVSFEVLEDNEDGKAPTEEPKAVPLEPVTLSSVTFQSISLGQPLSSLKTNLVAIHEPLCRSNAGDNLVTSQIMELLGAIRSHESLMIDFKVSRYVHPDITNLCAEHPTMEVRDLLTELGARANDNTFAKELQNLRGKCVSVFDVDVFNHKVGTFREEAAYWQHLDAWLEDIRNQLQSREFQLVQRILVKRGDATVEKTLMDKKVLVSEFHRFMMSIPHRAITDATREQLPAAVRQVFEQLSRSQKFPSDRLMKVADSIVELITERALDIASECNLLFMKPNEAMQCLASIRAVFTEAQIGYTQTKDLRGGGVRRSEKQPTIARAVERIQLLHDFINSHFSLDSALTSIFATDKHEFIVTLRSEYATLQKGNSFLWELQGAGQLAFEAALKQYNTALDKLDDQLAHMVRNKLDAASSGEEMFRIHETFQKIRREKVKMIISNKHDELISLIGHTIDDIKRRYFDDDATSRAVVLGVAQGHSPLVANIKWHRSIEQALNEQLGKRDAVSQFGWHQLISLQTIDFNWVLNTQLLNFIGVTHADIMKDARMAAATPEVAGGALALAYLDLVYVDERPEWEKTINVGTAKQQLEKCDTSALTAASTVLRQLGVGSRHSTTHQSSRDSRMLKDKIHQGIRDNVRRWCTHVRNVLSQCTHDASTRNLNGKIFRLKGVYLEVQFPSEMTSLATDYNELTSAGLILQSNSEWDDVRMFIDNNSKKVQLATVLSQLLDLFYRKQELDEDGHIAELLMAEFDGVYELLLEGAKHRWSGFAVVENFVEKLASKMDDLCTQIDDVRAITSAIDDTLVIMEHDNCDPVKIGIHIADIKRLVNDLAIKTTTSQVFLHRLQPRVDDILCGHLQDIVYAWLEEFESLSSDPAMIQRTDAKTAKFGLSPLRVTVRVTKDDVRLDTFPFVWRNYWYDKFNESIDWINNIPHFDTQNELSISVQNVKTYGTSYTRLVDKLPKGLLQKVYAAIEGVVTSTMVCEDHWRTHSQQVLHQDISEKARTLTTLSQWQDAIVELREFAQEQMNDTRPLIGLGGVVVDAKDAQTSLKARFEQVETALLDRFGKVVSSQFAESLNVMRSHRHIVENSNLHGDTSEAIEYLRQVPVMESYVKDINALLPTYKTSEKMLFSSSSFQIGPSWLSVEAVVSEYTTLCDLMAKRKEVIDRRKDELEHFVHSKVKAVQARVEALERKYRQSNIADSDGPAAATLQAINDFYRDASEADQELKDVQQSQKALGFEEIHSSVLDSVLSDIKGQRQAYSSVKDLYDELEKLKETPFTEMQPRNLQQSLYGLQEKMSNFNPAVRHFSAYTTLDTYIKELLANHRFIQDLRSDAILDRHWISLKNQLKMSSWVISSLTIGDIWDSKPVANSKIYNSVIDTAQGQHRLQVQIDQISDFWATHPLETTFFQNKVTLIKGWDSLFEKLEEDMNSLAAMKLSPFYGDTIAATANDWDDKLNRAHQVLDTLVDVQRRWVYLDGIFAGSAEIRQQLPGEASQFDKTSREFVAQMPRAKGEAITVIKLITVEKIQNNLEKIARELTTIQKKLGEYLETQRSRFPRFYFVGDEDLLEVIGNGKDPLLVAKHLKKMFCGVSQVTLEPTKDKGGNITSMISPEVESVAFDKPFDTAGMAIYQWLSKLEETMVGSLKGHVGDCLAGIPQPGTPFSDWIQKSPAQIVALCIQIQWVRMVEKAIKEGKDVGDVEKAMVGMLSQLATDVLQSGLDHISRHKTEQVITVAVYQRDKARSLAQKNIKDTNSFDWLSTMRPYFDGTGVNCKMADATIEYSFEYLGLAERLVQTALTDKCFLTLTQALHTRLGGSPAGPAGTGKTETVKALGMQLGRFVLVFCCDETFDFKSMGRIFVGLCQVGAWGCFDEFNRLEERILSAVSQQIQCIQEGLKSGVEDIILADRRVNIHANMGMFITMNPGYAGRSNLPDNLKQLFRGVAMTSPDRENIAEVMLFAQGFKTAEVLSRKIVPLFRLCRDQLSQQSHYDFGLRALKSVLVSAGGLKRAATARGDQDLSEEDEIRLMMQSLTETITPKLIAEDVTLFKALLRDVFPGCTPKEVPLDALEKAIKEEAASHQYIASDLWIAKIIQLYKILKVNHGIMLVGGSGCGKTSAWMTLLRALARVEDVDGHAYIIDPKALSKSELYGVLDPTTREWRDGVFTSTLRKIVDNVKGDDQSKKRHWIFFDGDVDPEWVENLNSLLDDNKLLTLPNGERLTLPPNVRIMFEVQDLRYATPATVSRCGMVWFSKETITHRHLLDHHVREFRSRSYCGKDETSLTFVERGSIQESRRDKTRDDNKDGSTEDRELIKIQNKLADATVDYFKEGGIIDTTLATMEKSFTQFGIMEYNRAQSIRSFFTLFAHSAGLIAAHTEQTDKELTGEKLKTYAIRRLLLALMWGFASQYPTLRREEFSGTIKADIPGGTLLDYEVRVEDGEWSELRKRVVKTDIPATKVGTNDVVIPTVDTARHEDVISAWIRTGKPVILCGPPGSGKTMSLTAVLRASTQYEAAFLNFSSGTAPDTITKIFDQYCTIKSTLQGLILTPTSGKRLIVFCDEINLPSADKYGTQRVVQFLRQLTERHGYYRPKDNAWITLERIQFVGACNPPTDPGRVSLTHRFLRWAPVLFVDFPSYESLLSIYDTYCRGLLQKNLKLRPVASNLAKAMVDVYRASQDRFTAEIQRHYVYSPRELSRWSRAIFEGIQSLDEADQKNMTPDELVRLTVHEGLRLFRDRLTNAEEEQWTDDTMDKCFTDCFPTIKNDTLARPILFSTVLSRAYTSATRDQLRVHIREKLKAFANEELDVELVVFDAVVDHVIRIDRVLRQPLGHMLLVGAAGVGKTVLSRFVAWMNNLSVFQIKAHRGYTIEDFEEDLRGIMRRSGCKREKICFIFDESNIMDSNFLEYMNALLASGEVPGLFDGEEWPKLMHEIREGVNAAGSASSYVDLSSEQDMYKWFITNVQLYLHVVFTMNPHSPDFHNRSATSPALFNRCTIDWFGDWSSETIFQVARELTAKVDVMQGFSGRQQDSEIAHDIVARVMCRVHSTVSKVNENVRAQSANRGTFITPRHFLDYIQHFHALNKEKSGAVEDLQRHLNTGLSKLRETSDSVDEQQKNLTEKEKVLAVSAERAKVMLAKIIDETTKAEAGKKAAIALKAVLEGESKTLNEQRATVEEQLGDAEPALLDAEKALNTIKPEHLREIRAYTTPPPLVKKVLEAVITVMGEKRAGEWEVIKQYTRKDDFIGQVKAFKSSEITDAVRDRINKNFLSDPNFTYDAAMRSSKAAGPLQKWVSAQVRFSEIYSSVAPMREKIDALSVEYEAKLAGLTKAEADIEENDASIAKLKSDYEVNTTETAQIRAEIAMVGDRCKRAKALMEKLLAEKTRWEEQSANFRAQSASVLGDCLISAAFLAYIGYFDELNRRQNIIPEWQDVIDEAQIDFARDLSVIEYLSKPEDRLKWQSNKLPQDSLCVENAIIMERYNRYPLIIDPSGQAVDFLLNYMKDKNITKTSFLDKAFMKHLEMAVRVGYPILVQDVEFIDPVLNPLLNREIRRIGGRRVVRLGAQDIDISPTFQLYMSTRDSSFQFAPDVCGRSAMVNFTVTLSSLQSQCMHSVMLQERPDIDEKRTDLMKLQGEYLFRLRMLEQQLLKTISDAEGNILENDALIKTLETLKSESAEIQTKMGQSNVAYQEISDVEEKYTPMAAAASRLYFSLSSLTELNSIYRFSLRFFFDVIKSSISNLPSEFATDDRIPVIIRNVFTIAHYRVTRSLFQEDHLAFELRLAQLRCSVGDQISRQVQTPEWDMLLTTTASPNVKADSIAALPGTIPRTLSQALLAQTVTLLSNSSFMSVKQSLCKTSNDEKWDKFFTGATDPLKHIPDDAFDEGVSSSRRAFLIALLAKVTRPDMFTVAAEAFLTAFFDHDARGTNVVEQYKQKRFLSTQAGFTVEQALDDLTSSVPLLLVAAAGYDASGRVEDLARQTGMSLQVVAMGSPEGYEEANSFVSQGMRLGSWVLLKNVHLASQFLATLEKRIHSEQLEGRINQNFRLFLSSEPSEKIPHSLVMASVVMVFEPPPGIKSNMLRVLSTIKPSQIPQYPKELPRLYFIAAWLHSVVMERMNYLPLGWSKRYEFSEADFRRVIGTIESWVGLVRGDRHHVPPEELPWPAIRTLVADTIYGGRIDNSFDQILLESFCSTFFTPAAFGPKFNFIASTENPLTCDGITMDDFNTWAANLPVVQSPEWLGLPSTATEMVLIQRANRTMERLIKIQNVFLEESTDDKSRGGSSSPARGQSVGKEETGARWAQKLLKSLQVWQDIIGKATFKPVPITSSTSIALALKRESSVGEKLLEKVRLDITEMMDVCRGTLKPNNYHRTLIEAFSKELVPSSWNRYTVPPSLTLRTWLLDFKLRLDRLQGLLAVKEAELHKHPIHMGSLFFPEAFLTATRQSVARHNNLALEKLELQLLLFSTPADAPAPKESDITLVGLTLFSAQLNKQDIISPIAEKRVATSQVPLARLTWQTKEAVTERLKGAAVADFPLYLSADRVTNLGKITLPVDTKVPMESWYQRGSCLTIWSADEK